MSFHKSKLEMNRRQDFRIGGRLPADQEAEMFALGRF